ncbi:MAG: hypothetical protein Fur0018_17870 [Anaerolineales bacterium]
MVLLLGGFTAAWFAWQDWQHAVVVIEWSTASELDTIGFNLYRSESPSGPFEQINDRVIPSAGDALTGSDYRYQDDAVVPGRVYYYELEDLSAGDAGERHGPIEIAARGQVGLPAALAILLFGGAAFWGTGSASLPRS